MRTKYPTTLAVVIAVITVVGGYGCKREELKVTSNDAKLKTFSGTQVSLDATAGCINAIHARLVSLKQDYSQLSEVNGATITATSLSYAKGNVLYEGKREHWSSSDACKINVWFEKYSPLDMHQQAGGRKFPESGIQVNWSLHRAIPSDSKEFLMAVSSIIREEIERFEKTLE
jgi:hypothetical protein